MTKQQTSGRRGFKLCKNPDCKEYLHINQHICQFCLFDNVNQQKKNIQLPMRNKIMTITKKYNNFNQSQIYTWKKYFLYKDEFNRQPQQIESIMQHKQFAQIDNNPSQIMSSHTQTSSIQFNNFEKQTIQMFKSLKFENKENKTFVFYLGFPINTLSWLPRSQDQYCAVGISMDDLSSFYSLDMNYVTVQTYGLQYLTKLGLKYEKSSGYIALFELKPERDYEPTLIYTIPSWNSSITQMVRFQRKFNVYCILKSGNFRLFEIYRLDLYLQKYSIVASTIITVSESTLLSCFDWLNNQKGDTLVAGDQIGHIYLIKVQKDSFEILKIFAHAHSLLITDIKFYQQSQSGLFASCSYDGTFKIFDIEEIQPIYEQQFSTKKLNSIMWDQGGKYVLVNKEGCSPSTTILSFFAAFKTSDKSIQISNKHETRKLDKNQFQSDFFQDTLLTISGSYFNKYVFMSDNQGNVFYYGNENLRKLAVKRIKNNKGKIRLFSKNQYDSSKNIFLFQTDQYVELNRDKIQLNELTDEKQQIFALEVCPNNILSLSQEKIDTILAYGNFKGFLTISIINSKY